MYSLMTAVVCVVLTIMILVVLFQVRDMVKRQREEAVREAAKDMRALADNLAENHRPGETIAETAKRCGIKLKDSKRRARQRKATRRMK